MAKVYAGEKVKAIFKSWDTNGDGFIDNKEFAAAFAAIKSNVDIYNLINLMEEELGKGGSEGATKAAGADKKFSYEEFIDWLKLDSEIVVKWSTLLPTWCKIAGQDPEDKGIHPKDITVSFMEMETMEKYLIKDFGFTKDMAMKAQMDMSYYKDQGEGQYTINFESFIKILKLNPAIDYIDDSEKCDKRAVYAECRKAKGD